MKKTLLLCDVCHNEMQASGKMFKIKYKNPDIYCWDGCWERSRWHKFEMCDECMGKFQSRVIRDKILENGKRG